MRMSSGWLRASGRDGKHQREGEQQGQRKVLAWERGGLTLKRGQIVLARMAKYKLGAVHSAGGELAAAASRAWSRHRPHGSPNFCAHHVQKAMAPRAEREPETELQRREPGATLELSRFSLQPFLKGKNSWNEGYKVKNTIFSPKL